MAEGLPYGGRPAGQSSPSPLGPQCPQCPHSHFWAVSAHLGPEEVSAHSSEAAAGATCERGYGVRPARQAQRAQRWRVRPSAALPGVACGLPSDRQALAVRYSTQARCVLYPDFRDGTSPLCRTLGHLQPPFHTRPGCYGRWRGSEVATLVESEQALPVAAPPPLSVATKATSRCSRLSPAPCIIFISNKQ